jgi:hypothetical protein
LRRLRRSRGWTKSLQHQSPGLSDIYR